MRKIFLTILIVTLMMPTAEAKFLGIFGPDPKPKIYKYGMKDKEIVKAQNLLIKHGYLQSKADGAFGQMTLRAVYEFQKDAMLGADGVIGPQTMKSLEKWKGPKKPAPKPTPKPAPKPAPAPSQKKPESGWIPIEVEATAYTRYDEGCTDYTYLETYARRGVVAVDPDIIPLRSKLFVPGYGYAVAEDIGGAIQGHRIDLFMETLEEAFDYGRRKVVVYLIK